MFQKLKQFAATTALVLLGLTPGIAPATDVTVYFHNDPAGNPLVATDAGGNVVWKASYQPYGQEIDQPAAGANNEIWFHGKPYDPATGLSYFGARYYGPIGGRFMGIDPKGFDEANIHSFNRYAYGNNNPYKYTDPDGRSPLLLAPMVVGAVIGGGINAASQYNSTGTVRWGGLGGVLDAAGDGAMFGLAGGAAVGRGGSTVANPVSGTLARVVPGSVNPTTLGAPGAVDVFVTNASELRGLTASQIAQKLTIPESSSGFRVLEFPTNSVQGIASPINRTNPGFIQGGKSAGGASEFVIPNGPLPKDTIKRVVE